MKRFFLEYHGDQIALPAGEHLIGRGLACTVRLHDATVSREHVRLEVQSDTVFAVDLGSRNGTLVNGRSFIGRRALQHGDVLQVGQQRVRLAVFGAEAARDAFEIGQETAEHPPGVPGTGEQALGFPHISAIDCPKCREHVPAEQRACPKCGHVFPRGGPLFATQIIDMRKVKGPAGSERRRNPRLPVEVLVLYVSDNLTINALARDLSVGGVYLGSELTDPIGTSCELTFLPEGRPPVQCRGIVRHLIKTPIPGDNRPPGMGVQFTSLGLGGKEWLITLMKRR